MGGIEAKSQVKPLGIVTIETASRNQIFSRRTAVILRLQSPCLWTERLMGIPSEWENWHCPAFDKRTWAFASLGQPCRVTHCIINRRTGHRPLGSLPFAGYAGRNLGGIWRQLLANSTLQHDKVQCCGSIERGSCVEVGEDDIKGTRSYVFHASH